MFVFNELTELHVDNELKGTSLWYIMNEIIMWAPQIMSQIAK